MRRLTAVDLPRAIDVVSRAFHDDPGLNRMFPDGGTRARVAPRLYRMSLGPGIENGQVYGVGEPVEGVAVWKSPNQPEPTFAQYVRAGGLGILFGPALIHIVRSVGIERRNRAMHRRHAPWPHYYLSILAVAPESQGKGLASRLVKPILAVADERSRGAYLETMNPRNVPLYEHFGFIRVEEYHVPRTDLTVWAFYRPPRG